jgi:hypothetical protein
MPAPSEMGGAGTTGHAPIPEEEEDDEEVDEAGVEAKVQFTLMRQSFVASAVTSVPHGPALILVGRIRIRDGKCEPDPDPGGQ